MKRKTFPPKKMILLDRDKTLNYDPGYIRSPEQVQLLPKVAEALRLLKNHGFIFVIVTNQSGIGRGYFTESDLEKVHARLSELLRQEEIVISDYFICPHTPQENCNCRKPKDGLVQQALAKYKILPQNAYLIGDRLRDIEAGEGLSINGILLSYEKSTLSKNSSLPKNLLYQATDLKEAADFILQNEFEKFIRNKIFSIRDAIDKNKNSQQNFQKNHLEEFLKEQVKENKKIIFTNGCFDILHPGHIQYLWQASRLGDTLIVGLNSDQSVKRLKGQSRPVNTWYDRALLLASLESVAAVFEFGEDTPENLIEKIRPQIHVKGGDYKAKDLPEYKLLKDIGAEVVILPFRKGYSTTNFLERVHEKKNKK